MKWDGQAYVEDIKYGLFTLLTDEEKQRGKTMSNYAFALLLESSHNGVIDGFSRGIGRMSIVMKCIDDGIEFDFQRTLKDLRDSQITLTWSMAARHIRAWLREDSKILTLSPKENARSETYKSTASICSTCVNNGECVPKITDTCIAFSKATEEIEEEKDMTTAFDLGAMLSTPPAATENQIKQIPCDILVPYHNHKFELYSGERLDDMVTSVRENGVLIPIIVQSLNGKYEILIGHNRWNASKIAGLPTVPAIIKEGLSEEEAEMYVIESNLMQRGFDNLKISEQAAVIAMRYKDMFSQGKRNDIIHELKIIENPELAADETAQTEKKPHNSREKVGSEYGLSRNSVARLLRVDKLIEGLKPLVDNGTIPIRAAVNVSYLSEEVQIMLIKLAKIHKLDIKKSEQLREYSDTQGLEQLTVIKILTGQINNIPKQSKPKNVKISNVIYTKYFDEKAKAEEVSETIEKALELYFANING